MKCNMISVYLTFHLDKYITQAFLVLILCVILRKIIVYVKVIHNLKTLKFKLLIVPRILYKSQSTHQGSWNINYWV